MYYGHYIITIVYNFRWIYILKFPYMSSSCMGFVLYHKQGLVEVCICIYSNELDGFFDIIHVL